jgi:sulfite reductase (ferredoxin)
LQDEGDDGLYFMLRLKLEKASLTVKQIRELSSISKDYARDTATLTTRQNIQFHHIAVKDLPTIFDRLRTVGLSSIYAAGDVPRNILCCPIGGIDHSELIDVDDTLTQVNDYFRGNMELVNLPRKYKVGISACAKHCMGHEIQDLSFTAVRIDDSVLFDVSIGGGLASNKQIASHIGYCEKENILQVVKVVSTIYRDFGLRENRKKARLGHLLDEWGLEKFMEVIQNKLDFKLKDRIVQEYTAYSKREHFGAHASIVPNKSYIGCAINGGKLGSGGLETLANILEKHNATTIRTTNTQNFIITDVPTRNVEAIIEELALHKIDANPSAFKARTLSCTGIEFCKFAVTETKSKAVELTNYLEEKFPDFKDTLSISLNGCPNSCSVPHIVDIGLQGCKLKNKEGETVTGFELILAGNLEGDKSIFGEKANIKLESAEVNTAVEKLITTYIDSDYTVLHEFFKDTLKDEAFLKTLKA